MRGVRRLLASGALFVMAACAEGSEAPSAPPASGSSASGLPTASPEARFAEAAEAVGAIGWSSGLERQVAGLLVGRPGDPAALEALLVEARPALDGLDAATRGPWSLAASGDERPTRDEWEAAVWLAYGDATLAAAAGERERAWARSLLADRVAARLAGAEGASFSELIIAFGLAEAGALHVQRMTALRPPSAAEAASATGLRPIAQEAWDAALRTEAQAATARIAAMADDPARAAGPFGEAPASPVPPTLDVEATQDAAVGLFLAAASRTLEDCPAPLDLAPPVQVGNTAGQALLSDLAAALARLDDRRCLTEAARRAAVIALRLRAGAAPGDPLPPRLPEDAPLDPMTIAPFGYDPARAVLWSAGADRRLEAGPGQGPFDDREPTWFLDLRPLL